MRKDYGWVFVVSPTTSNLPFESFIAREADYFFYVTEIGQRNDPQLLFRYGLVVAFRDQGLCQLVLYFLAELLFDDLAGRFAGAIAWDPSMTRVVARDGIPLLSNFFRRQFDPQRRQTLRLIFNLNFHLRSDVTGEARDAQ